MTLESFIEFIPKFRSIKSNIKFAIPIPNMHEDHVWLRTLRDRK